MADAMSRQDTPERILKAATKLFYAQGIRAVGVDAVAAAAGVTKRTLYYHYPSKDALIAAFLARWAAAVPDAPDLTPDAAIAAILGRFGELRAWFGTDRFRGCPFVNAVTEVGTDNPPAVAVARSFKAGRRAWFSALLARQLMLLVDGAIVTALVRGTPEPAEEAEAAARTLLGAAGLLPSEPRGS